MNQNTKSCKAWRQRNPASWLLSVVKYKGNVRVISRRANVLRSNATLEEMQAVVQYIQSFT